MSPEPNEPRGQRPELMPWFTLVCVASLVTALIYCEMPLPTVANPNPQWGTGSVLAIVLAAVWLGASIVDQWRRGP